MILAWLANHWLWIAAPVVGIAAIAQPVIVWKFKAWILLGVVLWWGWTGHAAADALQAKCAKDQLKAELAHNKAVDAANARADAINKTLQAELAKPKSGPVIREVVRAYPSNCSVPKPVADSLREAIRRANEAAR